MRAFLLPPLALVLSALAACTSVVVDAPSTVEHPSSVSSQFEPTSAAEDSALTRPTGSGADADQSVSAATGRR